MNEIEILLVEDNPNDVELTLLVLGENKLANQVQVVRDGEEALDFIFCRGTYSDRSFLSPPKLILLDLRLPKLDGMQVLTVLKTDVRTQSIPIIVLTSSLADRDFVAGYQLGVDCYVEKPVRFHEFREAIERLGFFWLLAKPPLPRTAAKHEEGISAA